MEANMEHMTVGQIVNACKGTLLLGEPDIVVKHISLNSKTMKGNDLFIPLIGEHVDAHKYIGQAMENGAVAVFTSEHKQAPDNAKGVWIKVEDTKKALQSLGTYCRSLLHLPVIGITGSVGKTTTREMVAAALSASFEVFKTPGNYNSQVGVPVTLSEIGEDDEIAVIELGMSEPGEMTVIAKIAQVDMAIITNIGVTHIGQLGSQENIYREKMAIQDGLKPGGTLILNGDDKWLKNTKAKAGCHTIYYGMGKHCDYRAEDVEIIDGYPSFTAICHGKRVPVRLKVMGEHQVRNALAALAVADLNGIPVEKAAEALKNFGGYQGRQQIFNQDGVMVIDDTYNASPASMIGAIDILSSLTKVQRRIAVLADMKELGEEEVKFHQQVGEHLGKCQVEMLLTYGVLAEEIQKEALKSRPELETVHFQQKEELEAYLFDILKKGDAVLLKGSNSMKLGEVAQHVCQHHY